MMPFDNSSGLVTAIAVVNPTAASETVSVNFQTDTGSIITGSLPALPAQGHNAFVLPTQFPAISGKRGLAEFSTATGSLSIIALRANPTLAFTSAPVYSQTGSPIIGGPPPLIAPFTSLTATATFKPAGYAQGTVSFTLTPNAGASTYTAAVSSATTFINGTVSNQGQTFTFNSLQPGFNQFAGGIQLTATSGSMTFTLTQTSVQGGQASGTLTGTLTITGSGILGGVITASGPITGTYTAAQ
jgi:hypothetical protein